MIRIKKDIISEPVSLDDVKQFIKFEDDDNTDEIYLISSLIKEARTYFEKRTDLCFARKTIVETFKKSNDNIYKLSLAPFISIVEINAVDIEGTETELTLNSDYYKRGDYEIEIITGNVTTDGVLKVEYYAGYGDSLTELLPMDLRQAIKRQVIHWYDNRDEYQEMKIMPTIDNILRAYNRHFL